MLVKQIYEFVNNATAEALGDASITADENLSNIVDVGNAIFDANAVDAYVRSLINHIGRVVFVNRPYSGSVPSVLMDGWEYGSVMEKISAKLPDAEENESWELQDGQSYDQNIFYKPQVTAKFFNKRTTFEIPLSITEKQVKQSFSNATQLNAFMSMLYNEVDKSMTIKTDELVMRTINNMIADTVYDDYAGAGLDTKSGVKAVNLLYQYNTETFASSSDYITAAQAIHDPEFIRYASFKMGLYADRLRKISTLFNIGGEPRFTPADMLHVVLLSEFKNAAGAFLQSDTFHDQYTALPKAETVAFWQGSGTDYAFSSTGKIDVVSANNHNVAVTGILGVMFDRDALGVSNLDKRVTTHYNAKGEFFNNWYKQDAGYFNDQNENFVVFFIA